MASVNARLSTDSAMREALITSTNAYVAKRDEIESLGAVGHPGGGPDRVKCLHAHTAHTLITGDNPVGEATLEHLRWSEPQNPCA